MPQWVELLTSNNYATYIPNTSHVDIRNSANPLSLTGVWFPKQICPYLSASVVALEDINNATPLPFNSCTNEMFWLTDDGNLDRVQWTTDTDETFNGTNTRTDTPFWKPILNKSVIDNAIVNPWPDNTNGFRINSATAEVTWGEQSRYTEYWSTESYAAGGGIIAGGNVYTGHADLYLVWVKFPLNPPYGSPYPINHLDISDNGSNGETTYTDYDEYVPGEIIGVNSYNQGHKIIEQNATTNVIDADDNYSGVQITDCTPVSFSGTVVPDSNLIEHGHIVIPAIFSSLNAPYRCQEPNDDDTQGWSEGTSRIDSYYGAYLHWNRVHLSNFKVKLTTKIKKED